MHFTFARILRRYLRPRDLFFKITHRESFIRNQNVTANCIIRTKWNSLITKLNNRLIKHESTTNQQKQK